MEVYNFFKSCNKPLVIALGFFDCIHKGHVRLIETAKNLAESAGAVVAVFTFKNDIHSVFSEKTDGLVLTFEERLLKLRYIGVENILTCDFNKEFAALSPQRFLELLYRNFNVKGIVCGDDYTFGNRASGNTSYLAAYCKEKGIAFSAVSEFKFKGKRISTTLIKSYLKNGDIVSANEFLYLPYFICGKVIEGRRQGRTIGFPTANILPGDEKFKLKHGVYKTRVFLNEKEYKSITNYGEQPTFGQVKTVIETHIKDFNGNLYGKDIIIIFDDYIRDIEKFSDTRKLKEQLLKDMEVLND